MLEDGCAAFDQRAHAVAIEALASGRACRDGGRGARRAAVSEALVRPASGVAFGAEAEVLIIGAGAAGLVAALAAREAGAEPVVVERDAVPRGSTALSAGLIPAAGTRWQEAARIADGPECFAADILRKTKGRADRTVLTLATREARRTRCIGSPTLMACPSSSPRTSSIPATRCAVCTACPPEAGRSWSIACARRRRRRTCRSSPKRRRARCSSPRTAAPSRVWASSGRTERRSGSPAVPWCSPATAMAATATLVRRHLPELAEALWFGHDGNRGEAVLWGEALGAELRHLSGHQGHGNVAHPHGILITWTTIMQGGIQVNAEGERFSDETEGYSEQAARVLAQPGGFAWTVFDERIAGGGACLRRLPRRRGGRRDPARRHGRRRWRRCSACRLGGLPTTLAACRGRDRFGREWSSTPPLAPPYRAVRVTGALFHTQGGLAVDSEARVLGRRGGAFPNLFAAGGAAVGVSGPEASGYLSGNGLLTAIVLGRLAGRAAALSAR
ncbi:MAG: FAD-binding protein [Acetobacteraceae bacterium]|nr:FAD-binding protein [Acetobacteraceae bacterium]